MSRTQRALFAAVAVAIAVAAIVLVAGGEGPEATNGAGAPAVVSVVGGVPEGGVRALAYEKGERVRLTVESDSAEVVHVHGYGLRAPVRKGAAARFSFTAGIEGEFVIELEGAKRQIAALRVRP